jgi:tRNA-(ms[2]io[6]A)-hydroxylase
MNISAIFIAALWKAKAGHYTLFIELAETYVDKEKVRKRWAEWLKYEAGVINDLEVRGDRIH